MSDGFEITGAMVIQAVQWLKLLIETMGAITVGVGMLLAVWQSRMVALREADDCNPHPPDPLALPGARTGVPARCRHSLHGHRPSWQEIGKLGAIAVIRTGLNWFLSRERVDERDAAAALTRARAGS